MSRARGELVSTNFSSSHYVRLTVPELGFGDALDVMVQYCLERDEKLHTGWLRARANDRAWIVFSFRHRKNAKDFAQRFSGEVFVLPTNDVSFSGERRTS